MKVVAGAYPLSVAIVEAIASEDGVDCTNLDFTLQDYVDLDAIDALMEFSESFWELTFSVHGHSVIVASDGTITVDGTEYR